MKNHIHIRLPEARDFEVALQDLRRPIKVRTLIEVGARTRRSKDIVGLGPVEHRNDRLTAPAVMWLRHDLLYSVRSQHLYHDIRGVAHEQVQRVHFGSSFTIWSGQFPSSNSQRSSGCPMSACERPAPAIKYYRTKLT